VAYTITSDARFKENIKYDDVPGLNFIKELKPVTYTFDTKKFDEHLMQNMEAEMRNERLQNEDYKASSAIKHSGFLAQDIESTCKKLNYEFDGLHTPDAMNKTDHYSVAYSQFIMPLVKAVQELQVLIEKVQQENDQLRKEIVAVNTNVALLLKK
jgi:hypothetical protein